jgi:hypothetical protein
MIASSRKEKIFRSPRDLAAEFEKLCTLLTLSEREAAELAIRTWVKANRDEAQKKLDLYAERGITIIEPQTVNIAVFQRAEILVAKEELTRLLGNMDRCNPEYRPEIQLELAKALKRIQPIYIKTRDPELQELLRSAEERLGA